LKERQFYEAQYLGNSYSAGISERVETGRLDNFIRTFNLQDKLVLEIGCGRGAFQYLAKRWIGLDISFSVRRHVKKPFVVASAQRLPFKDRSFDALWSVTTLEHVPEPETVLEEIRRILRPGGSVYLAPAWHCRSWAASGHQVRPWSDFDWKGKIVKASIPFRNNLLFRAACTLPVRLWREWLYFKDNKKHTPFRYKQLMPNYEKSWCADSDACNSMDPHEMLLWFRSRGWLTPSHPGWITRLTIRHGELIVSKHE
jgi:SAM-dependent methyltransferase